MEYDVKELPLGDVLSRAFDVLQRRFLLLYGIAAILTVPFDLASVLPFLRVLQRLQAARGPNAALVILQNNIPSVVVFCVLQAVGLLLILPLTHAALTHAVGRIYLGKPATMGKSYSYATGRLAALLWSLLFTGFAIIGGMLLCVIPGIVFSVWFAFVTQIVVIERLSGTAAMGRSRALTKGGFWNVLATVIVLGLIGGAVHQVTNVIPDFRVQVILQMLLHPAIAAYSGTVIVILYFSERCRVEEFDRELLAETFDDRGFCHDCGERLPTNATACPVCGTERRAARDIDSWDN